MPFQTTEPPPAPSPLPPGGSSFEVANRNAFSFLAFAGGEKGGGSEIVKCKCDRGEKKKVWEEGNGVCDAFGSMSSREDKDDVLDR